MPLTFEILHRSPSSRARLGRVSTPHGSFDTPAFMPVGTRGSVKGLLPGMVADTGAQIILGNTYHLMLRPGADLIHRLGGLHAFTNWPGPMLTDSGGYQAYSLSHINKIDDDGVTFQSIIDGSPVTLTPESAMHIQNLLAPDIIMAFDDCPPADGGRRIAESRLEAGNHDSDSSESGSTHPPSAIRYPPSHAARLRLANERTLSWLSRCRAEHHLLGGDQHRALFGIIQGGTDLDQRSWSAERIANIDLPGYAIGGVAVGEGFDDIARVVSHTAPLMPDAKPRYLMGVGYERDLLAAVLSGVDMFDCVLPTRNGRNASAFTPTGQIRLRNAKYAEDPNPIEPGCDCVACRGTGISARESQGHPARASAPHFPPPPSALPASPSDHPFSRAYIRHLFQAEEMLGPILVSLHNLRYFQRFMADIRRTIRSDDPGAWAGFGQRWPAAAPGLGVLAKP